ncbi:hypothetical protein GCM10008927_04080 [Amylibacter ulvae]|uniref:Uncharacterized protein n=1 Tax=Paramylibacter ulvae TaxID=1651968 RepID=A0ABQ3CV17_9RHOB|nr:hypothetical protein [Amylibacter ulvae]GHA42747.1 hypothetical protein GCM10008927_04080 [Amylibacter ulvae]
MNKVNGQRQIEKRRRRRKLSELSLGILALGICLLLTPMINAFTLTSDGPNKLGLLAYIFGTWAALIICAFILSRFLVSEVADE